MNITIKNGNLLDSKAELLVHQVNCQGVMGSGVAKCIRDKYPTVYEQYKNFADKYSKELLLGHAQCVTIGNNQAVINLFGQMYYGNDGKQYTSYDAVWNGLNEIKSDIKNTDIKSIAFPYGMSCGRGGANWEVIRKMIEETFIDMEIEIEFWNFLK